MHMNMKKRANIQTHSNFTEFRISKLCAICVVLCFTGTAYPKSSGMDEMDSANTIGSASIIASDPDTINAVSVVQDETQGGKKILWVLIGVPILILAAGLAADYFASSPFR